MGFFWQYIYMEILGTSSLSSIDYIRLVGHYNKLRHKEKVDPQLAKRGYSEAALAELEKRMAAQSADVYQSMNLRIRGPLRRFVYPHFGLVMTLFEKYHKHGVLPFPGSHADQPAQIIEIFEVLAGLQHELEEDIRREQERQAKKRGKRG